ncbi:hypothetical protein D915_000211 [Fasciola hepatica]|uniref:Uncharacterized protein n=1 Tax=Fasciola hepatica TaxID=6192 RepID=A0A4E0S3I3_FASHE|nr:hypothetical protein D915_000211 [Fasciola hepatica]
MVVRLNPDQVQKSMLLTGPLARRWYCALKRGATYRVLWQWTNDATDVPRLTSLRPVPNKPLIDENICSHVMSPQDALILARSRSSDSSHTVTTIHVQGLLVHKTVDISHGWCLWCAQVEQTNDRTTIPHLVRIYIPPELDWTQWSVGFPGPLCRIWIYDLHWVRLRAANGVSVKLMASALSRLEWAPSEPRGLAYPNNAQSPDKIRLFRRDCSHCNALWKSSDQDDAAPVDSLIGAVFLSAEHGVLDSDHSLFVRASIVKCLEFQWYTPENQCATTDRSKTSSLPPLKIYTRFLISDGSGCALVEFGRPSSENDYPTFSHASRSDAVDSLELARSLFGIDSVNWRRLCLVLERELSSSRQRSLGKSFFAVPLKSLTGLQKLSPLMFALRSYLTSATFLRTHKFHLKRLFPGSWKSSAGLWRLRQVRLREGANDGNPIGGPGQMISFVVPPLQLFRLLSIDNDF